MFGNELQTRKEERNPHTEIKKKKKLCRVETKIKAIEIKQIILFIANASHLYFPDMFRKKSFTYI